MSQKSQEHRDALTIGSVTKPPVLYRGDFYQWKFRYIHFINVLELGNEIMQSYEEGPANFTSVVPAVPDGNPPLPERVVEIALLTEQQTRRKKADHDALTYLLLAIPNDIYVSVDSNTTAKSMWDEITKLMRGTAKASASLTRNSIMSYENFKAKEGELLIDTHTRFINVINLLKKSGVKKTDLEANVKFLSTLNPEW